MSMTNHKAWAGALASILSIISTRLLASHLDLTAADAASLGPALQFVVEGAVAAGIGYAVVWFGPANREKADG